MTFVLVKSALQDASPLLFNCVRMTLAAVVLAVVNRGHLRAVSPARLRDGAVIGLFLAAGYELQTMGLARTTAAKSAFITGLIVVFVPALTLIPILRPAKANKPGLGTGVGAVLAFSGLLLLTTPAATRFTELFAALGPGDWLTLGCAVAFAAHLLALAHRAHETPAGLLATLQVGFAAGLMMFALPLEDLHFHLTPRLLTALLLSSVLATAAAFTVQSFAQQHLAPTHVVLLLSLEPVFAWLTSLLLLGQGLDGRAFLGALLILAGIVVIEFTPSIRSGPNPA